MDTSGPPCAITATTPYSDFSRTRLQAVQSVWRAALLTGAAASNVLMASTQPAVGEANPIDSVPRLSSALEGLTKIPWKKEGYLSWEYDGHKVNYVDEGDKTKVCPLYLTNSRLIWGGGLFPPDRLLPSDDGLSCHCTISSGKRCWLVLRRVYHIGLFVVQVLDSYEIYRLHRSSQYIFPIFSYIN